MEQVGPVGCLVGTGAAWSARLLVGVRHERAEPGLDQVDVVLPGDRQRAGCRRGWHQRVEFVQPGVLGHLDPAAAEPRHLGGAVPRGRQRAVDRRHRLAALVPDPCQRDGRLRRHREQERRTRRERRGTHPRADHCARGVPDHQPPVVRRHLVPLGPAGRHPVRHGGDHGVDHRICGQVVAGGVQELTGIGVEVQGGGHAGTLVAGHRPAVSVFRPRSASH
ncbi:hypothetical protein OG767_17910 [Micromonospora sp. NBC_01392]|uniref:hypothetical protein n=1 Tax=Micromonospora sp. NBC_01392 TaxID=2903588 RepID=UPI00324415F4